jgi:queuosine precursor transporter
MNFLLGIIGIIICFGIEILIEKFFKKEGLYVWISVALITANILVAKNINILNLQATMGNILFASTFLATDILSEKYSSKDSKKAINIGILSVILFTLATQFSLLFKPNELDMVNNSLKNIFTFNLRINISSIIMCYLSNMLDIIIFEKIKKKVPDKMWLRNNIATIISNCLENYFFTFFAFIGIYDIKTILAIATTTTILEIIIAICDTPFLYLSKKIK